MTVSTADGADAPGHDGRSASPDASETKRTVHWAIAANLVITLAKAVAGGLSGSAALLAEAAHSAADTGNQLLLRVSLARAEKPPDEEHPFGFGRERFFWALLVAVLMFVLGAIFSVGEGVLAFYVGLGRDRFVLLYAVLAVSLVAESVSLTRVLRELRRSAAEAKFSLRDYLRASTDPTTNCRAPRLSRRHHLGGDRGCLGTDRDRAPHRCPGRCRGLPRCHPGQIRR